MFDQKLIEETKRLILARYPRFAGQIANANLEFSENLKWKTAATDGKNIYIDPKYFESLSEDERCFLIAHEIMHIKFEHMFRLKSKDGEMRDSEIWNIATDAIINANLERDGFKIKEGDVNIPDALNYNAEELYQKLLEEKKEKDKQKGESGERKPEDQSEKPESQDGDENEQQLGDDHSLWEEAFKKREEENKNNKAKKQENKEDAEEQSESGLVDEKEEFSENRKERKQKATEAMERLKNRGLKQSGEKINFGDVGSSKAIVDWKMLLKREVEKTEDVWTQRRSIAENNYAYRLEENDIEDEALTEFLIDASGSVSIEMVKAALRQTKPLLRDSKLKVGCFNAKFWGFNEIKSEKDIDCYNLPQEARGQSAWTEDWDLAVRSFTKGGHVNKIVFTDGFPAPGNMPKSDLRGTDVIWLVYGSKKFNPCCGKVLYVEPEKLLKKSITKTQESGLMK